MLSRLRLRGRSRSILGLGGAIGVSQVTWAFTGILTARWLGPSGKGLVAAATSWAQVLGWLAGLGLAVAMQIRVARASDEDRPKVLGAVLGNGLFYALVVGGLVIAVAFVPLQRGLSQLGGESSITITLALLPLPLSILATTLGLLQVGLGRNSRYAAALVTGPATTLLIVTIVHLVGRLTPAALVASYIPGAMVAFGICCRRLPWRTLRLELPMLRADLRRGFRMWLSGALGLGNLRLDILVMATFLTATEVGLYSTANNILLPVVALPAAMTQLAIVSTARLDASHGREVSIEALRSDSRKALAFAGAGGLVLIGAAPFAVPWLLGPSYAAVVPLALILVIGYVARAVGGVVIAGANGLGLPVVGNRSEGVGLAATVLLLPVLLPAFGATGAAIMSTIAYLLSASLACTWLVRQSTTAERPSGRTAGSVMVGESR